MSGCHWWSDTSHNLNKQRTKLKTQQELFQVNLVYAALILHINTDTEAVNNIYTLTPLPANDDGPQ